MFFLSVNSQSYSRLKRRMQQTSPHVIVYNQIRRNSTKKWISYTFFNRWRQNVNNKQNCFVYRCPIIADHFVNDCGFFVTPELFGDQFVSIQIVRGLQWKKYVILYKPVETYTRLLILPWFGDRRECACLVRRPIWIWLWRHGRPYESSSSRHRR